MTSIINASPSNGITQTADGSGVMKVQSNGVTTNALAWVSFDGSNGTRRSSYNVTSVTRNSTGDYTINFTNALSDANYSCVGSAGSTLNNGNRTVLAAFYLPTTTSVYMTTIISTNSTSIDANLTTVAIFGN